jgi:hypothetical protein
VNLNLEHGLGVTSEAFLEEATRQNRKRGRQMEHHTSTKPNDSRFCVQIFSISFSNLYSFLNLSPIFGSHGFYSRLPLYGDGSLHRYSFHTKFHKKIQPQCLQKKSSIKKPTPLNVAQAIVLGGLSSATLQGGNS